MNGGCSRDLILARPICAAAGMNDLTRRRTAESATEHLQRFSCRVRAQRRKLNSQVGLFSDLSRRVTQGRQCGRSGLVRLRLLLTQHLLADAAPGSLLRSAYRRSSHCKRRLDPDPKLYFRHSQCQHEGCGLCCHWQIGMKGETGLWLNHQSALGRGVAMRGCKLC